MRPQPAPALSFFLFVSAALFSGLLAAQENPNRPPWAQKQKPAGDKSAPAAKTSEAANQEPDRSTIRVKVELVNVLVSVLDEHNRPAPDLPQDAFQLTDEGVPQTIAVFEKDTHQPLDLALMIDASLSAPRPPTSSSASSGRVTGSPFTALTKTLRKSPALPIMSPRCKMPSTASLRARALPFTTLCFSVRAPSSAGPATAVV